MAGGYRSAAYRYMVKAKGRKAAVSQLREYMARLGRRKFRVAAVAQDVGDYELAWELFDREPKIYYSEVVWITRALGELHEPGNADRRKIVEEYFRTHDGDPLHDVGRYLLGLTSEADFMAAAKGADLCTGFSYYLGLKAELEGRMREANDWYRTSLECGSRRVVEWTFAMKKLILWRGHGRTLELIGASPE